MGDLSAKLIRWQSRGIAEAAMTLAKQHFSLYFNNFNNFSDYHHHYLHHQHHHLHHHHHHYHHHHYHYYHHIIRGPSIVNRRRLASRFLRSPTLHHYFHLSGGGGGGGERGGWISRMACDARAAVCDERGVQRVQQ